MFAIGKICLKRLIDSFMQHFVGVSMLKLDEKLLSKRIWWDRKKDIEGRTKHSTRKTHHRHLRVESKLADHDPLTGIFEQCHSRLIFTDVKFFQDIIGDFLSELQKETEN